MKIKPKQKNRLYVKSITFVVLASIFLSFFPARPASAAMWPSIDPIIKQGLENVQNRINGIILGMLKQQAAKVLNSQVNKMVGGGKGSQAKFITNWQDYLVKQPQQNANKYMNDYLSKITGGKGSMTGYQSTGGIGLPSVTGGSSTIASLLGVGTGGGAGGYASQLVSMAKQNTVSQSTPKVTYQGSPAKMFASGSLKNFNLFLSGINNPWTFNANAINVYQQQQAQQQMIAKTKAVSNQGFIGTGEKKGAGKVSTPGIVVKENLTNTQDLGNKIIAGAQHPEEIITALVTQLINKVMQQGIGMASNMLNQQINQALGIKTQTNAAIKASGPGAVLNSGSSGLNLSNLLK